jgi:hypothetical protein
MSLEGVLQLLLLLSAWAPSMNEGTASARFVAGFSSYKNRFDIANDIATEIGPTLWSGGCEKAFFLASSLRSRPSWTSLISRQAFPSAVNGDESEIDPAALRNDETLLARMPPERCEKHALTLQEQARKLRVEADAMRSQLERAKAEKLAKRKAKVDSWIEQLLIEVQVDDSTQLLKTEEQVLLRLQEGRFSQEQINAIFNRICEAGPQSRSNCSPLMELLVDSVGKMDEVERQDNPNKRWSGKVERVLRRRLFAMDWNMDIEESEEDDDLNPWRLK